MRKGGGARSAYRSASAQTRSSATPSPASVTVQLVAAAITVVDTASQDATVLSASRSASVVMVAPATLRQENVCVPQAFMGLPATCPASPTLAPLSATRLASVNTGVCAVALESVGAQPGIRGIAVSMSVPTTLGASAVTSSVSVKMMVSATQRRVSASVVWDGPGQTVTSRVSQDAMALAAVWTVPAMPTPPVIVSLGAATVALDAMAATVSSNAHLRFMVCIAPVCASAIMGPPATLQPANVTVPQALPGRPAALLAHQEHLVLGVRRSVSVDPISAAGTLENASVHQASRDHIAPNHVVLDDMALGVSKFVNVTMVPRVILLQASVPAPLVGLVPSVKKEM